MDHINGFKAAVAAVLGCLTALWGWFGWLVVAWVACMLLDYATGTAAALKAGKWSCKAAREASGTRWEPWPPSWWPPSWTGCWA